MNLTESILEALNKELSNVECAEGRTVDDITLTSDLGKKILINTLNHFIMPEIVEAPEWLNPTELFVAVEYFKSNKLKGVKFLSELAATNNVPAPLRWARDFLTNNIRLEDEN